MNLRQPFLRSFFSGQSFHDPHGASPGHQGALAHVGKAHTLPEGVSAGIALQAAQALEGRVSVRVVNVPTIKPLDEAIVNALAADVKGIVTAEEHNVVGGLGAAIAQALCKACKPMEFVGVQDCFGCSAKDYESLLAHYGLTKEAIMEAALKIAQ